MFNRCSGVDATNPGVGIPTIDFGGTGQALAMKGYDGEVKFQNKSGTDAVSLDFASGSITIDDSVNAGDFVMRGVGTWENRETYAGNANIVNELVEGSLIQLLDRTVYDERVTVDSTNGQSGVLFPRGSPKFPVDNLTDALSIADTLSMAEIFLKTSETLPVGPNFSTSSFIGYSASRTTLTLPAGATINGTLYRDLVLTGDFNSGFSTAERCQIFGGSNFQGFMLQCALVGGTTIHLGGSQPTVILDSWGTDDATGEGPIIDMGGSGQDLQLRNFAGELVLKNLTGASNFASIELAGGHIEIDSATMTGGTVYLRGVGDWRNRSEYTGTTTIIDELVDGSQIKDIWTHAGLDPDAAITVTPTGVDSANGRIDINITGDGNTSNTFTRQ